MTKYDKVAKIIAEQCGISTREIRPDTTFDQLRFDSLDRVEVVMAIEWEFGCELSDNDVAKINTVQELVEMIP